MKQPGNFNPNQDDKLNSLEIESLLGLTNERHEYNGKYKISNWDFEYAEEHYEKDVIMAFNNDVEYSIDKALDKIRQKLYDAEVSVDWSKPINLQEIVDLYRKLSNDEYEKFYTIFERSGVFSIERLGYEELRDKILERTPKELYHIVNRKISKGVAWKLDEWKKRNSHQNKRIS
jgi:hypothetical protein